VVSVWVSGLVWGLVLMFLQEAVVRMSRNRRRCMRWI
jgi:hypothetical protein